MYVYDYKGNRFNSIKEMCKIYSVSVANYRYKIRNGYSMEEALNSRKPLEIVDHLGNRYSSIYSMCKAWGISQSHYAYRIKKMGWSIKDALETKSKKENKIA